MTRKAQQPGPGAYADAADVLGCEVAAIRAVAEVEAGGRAFLPSGEPVVLPEPHVFHRLTGGKFAGARASMLSSEYNELSYPKWRPGKYGPPSAQHAKLQAMIALDREAALKATSFGLFQLMGFNHQRCGHETIQAFVNAMYVHVNSHLAAFVNFIASDEKLHRAIQRKDWATVALRYNGSGYKTHNYDGRMAAAYAYLTRRKA